MESNSVCNHTSDNNLYHKANTPNANMAVHSVAARDELYESEASEASVFCSVNASPEKSCIVVNIWSFLFRYAYELLCF